MGTQQTIAQLIHEIEKADLILPEFQRGYVWNRTQVKEYLASLYRGYPTGSFLLWKTPNPGLVRGGAADGNANAFQLILDGQQRLTSVYALVKGTPPPFYEGEKLFFDIHFNVKTEEFSYFKPTTMRGSPEWLAVTPFLKYGVGEYLRAGGPTSVEEREYLMNFFDKLVQLDAIKTYTYYLDILVQRDMDEAVRIFNLVNSRGTRLGKSDLALSHICALWPDARQEMRATQREFKELGFDFGLDFYVRCLSSVTTESGRYEPLYQAPVEDIKSAWVRAKRALEYLMNVLRLDAFISSDSNLASEMPLVPLVVYLANGSGSFKDAREKRSFLHWLFAALMWARYSGSAETKLQEDLEALKADDAPAKLRYNLIADRGRIRVEASDLEGRTTQSPFFAMCYIVSRARGSVDWFNGQQLYAKLVGESNGLEYHHIFPQSVLYKKGGFDSTDRLDVNIVNEIANMAFLTKQANLKIRDREPSKYLRTVRDNYPDALDQQVVPKNPALWEIDRYRDFIAERRHRLAEYINSFMDELLEAAEETAGFTISDYIAAGESATVEFKGSLRWDFRTKEVNKALEKTIARTIAGFMNLRGGTLVVGVSDGGEIWGLSADFRTLGSKGDRDGWEQMLRNVLNTYLSKEIAALVDVSFAEVDGKTVAVLHADPSVKAIYLMDDNKSEFLLRSGNTTQALDVKQANAYIEQRFSGLSQQTGRLEETASGSNEDVSPRSARGAHLERFEERFQAWVKSACEEWALELPGSTFYESVKGRLHDETVAWIGYGLESGAVLEEGHRFQLADSAPGKGPYQWFSKGEDRLNLNWEYYVQVAFFVRLLEPCRRGGLKLTFEDDMMDLAVHREEQLVWYIEVKERLDQVQKLLAPLVRHGDGVDMRAQDRGDDPLRKAKYLVSLRPDFFSLISNAQERHFRATYAETNRFSLEEISPPVAPLDESELMQG